MSKSIAFWVLMLLWLVFGVYIGWSGAGLIVIGSQLIPFLAVAVLGWAMVGAPVQ